MAFTRRLGGEMNNTCLNAATRLLTTLVAVTILSLTACGEPGTVGNLCDQTDQIAFAVRVGGSDPNASPPCDQHDFDDDNIPAWADERDWELPYVGSYPPRADVVVLECRSEYYGEYSWSTIDEIHRQLSWGVPCRDYWGEELFRLCEAYATGQMEEFTDFEAQQSQFLEHCSQEQVDRYWDWRDGVLL